jgi:hypothetical protein
LQLAAHRSAPPTGNVGDHGDGRARQMRG